jgi:hypothetical protein
MSEINWREVAVIALAVALMFGSFFLPPFYKDFLPYASLAVIAFVVARWLWRRRSQQP